MTNAAARVALYISACIAACAAVTGCVAVASLDPSPRGAGSGPGSARTPTGESPAPHTALGRVVVGKSTKAEVVAALGPAIVISFDSGYEVWVYRWRGADTTTRAATEVVVLFDPSGRATKARLRPDYETPK